MVTRVRIDAEGSTTEEVLKNLDAAFAEILNKKPWGVWTFSGTNVGSSMQVQPLGTSSSAVASVFPTETEFVEEVIESVIADNGAIHRRGRRVLKFVRSDHSEEIAA